MDQREKAMDANAITRAYFDEILIEMRHIDNKIPDTTLHLYGETFSTPIMMAALSHLKGQGNEGDGMSRLVAEACDFKVSIPMRGRISSLNASNAAAILLYEAVRQRG